MSTELERLANGPLVGEKPCGLGSVRFIGSSLGNSKEVLVLARDTLKASLELCEEGIFDETAWSERLPSKFVLRCGKAPSKEEIEAAMLTRSVDERAAIQANDSWSVGMFMNSFLPELDMRYWEWWDAEVLDADSFVVAVAVRDWPFPWESLRWLFRGSGATDLRPEENE